MRLDELSGIGPCHMLPNGAIGLNDKVSLGASSLSLRKLLLMKLSKQNSRIREFRLAMCPLIITV